MNQLQKGSYTPLHYATYFGHCQVAKVLIDAGGDPNIPDDVSDIYIYRERERAQERSDNMNTPKTKS